MTRAAVGGAPAQTSSRRSVVAWLYFALAGAGLAGTWYFNLNYSGANYRADWFANPASSSAAIDLVVIVLVAATFYLRESRRLGWRMLVPVLFCVLSVAVAVSFALPLFLGVRERSTSGRANGQRRQ
jgi:drug/metabolite transporter (DMT)-like permease